MSPSELLDYAQEMEKQLSRRVRQEGLSGELGWCLVRYYRELIDGVYSQLEGNESISEVGEAEARGRLNSIYNRFETDLKRLAETGPPSESSFLPDDDDEGSVLDDITSVYYDDSEESSPEPEELPHTPSRTPIALDQRSESISSMIMSDDVSFLTIATPVPDRPGNPTPNANNDDSFPFIPFTPLPKHNFPGTYDTTAYAELSLSRGVPYEAQFIDLEAVDAGILLGKNLRSRGLRARKSLSSLSVFSGSKSPKAPKASSSSTSVNEDGSKKKMKKKRSFWKRCSSSDPDERVLKEEKKRKKEKEELRPPTFWCPM